MSRLKIYNPVTPSQRELILVDRTGLWRGRPEKSLVCGVNKVSGRNCHGRVTCRHRGGGARKVLRFVDLFRKKIGVNASVLRIEYDPNRTAYIALIKYEDGILSYIVAPEGLKIGDNVTSGENSSISIGCTLPLKKIPIGFNVHNIELYPGSGGKVARSAGSYAQIVDRNLDGIVLKLLSGELKKVDPNCCATIGVVSNGDHKNISIGKAGRNRWKGRRPHVRGVAMNPIDHPLGGGEGKSSGGRHPVSPWGFCAKGKKTRSVKKPKLDFIRSGR